RDPSLSSDAIAQSLREQFAREIFGASVAVFPPAPVRGVGRAGGFAMMVEDRGDFGPRALQEQTENLAREGSKLRTADEPSGPALAGVFSVFRANVPQIHIE